MVRQSKRKTRAPAHMVTPPPAMQQSPVTPSPKGKQSKKKQQPTSSAFFQATTSKDNATGSNKDSELYNLVQDISDRLGKVEERQEQTAHHTPRKAVRTPRFEDDLRYDSDSSEGSPTPRALGE